MNSDPRRPEADPSSEKAEDAPPDCTAEESKTKLSAAEQMALYEKELKENDWGHQPC